MNRCICTHAPEQHGVIGCDVRSWSGKPCPCEWRPSAPRHDAGTGDHPAPTDATATTRLVHYRRNQNDENLCGAGQTHEARWWMMWSEVTCSACLARRVASPPPSPGALAWLIEQNGDRVAALGFTPGVTAAWYVAFQHGWSRWTTNASDAKRFASKADAEAWIASAVAYDKDIVGAVATEHMWCPPPSSASPPPSPGGERPHIVNGQFQSDKYPTCPPGKVPLSVRDATAQDLLWVYAQRRRSVDAQFAADLEWALRQAGYAAPSPGGEDGTVGRFLAFAACQSDDTDRAICDAFYRAFVRLEQQLDDTQRRLQATEDARQRVCFARDRFAEQLEERIAADNRDAQRVATIADEAFGPFPVQTSDENLTAIERGIFGLRQRIGQLEAEKVAVADVASEGIRLNPRS